jgi:hypothetical protein
MLSDNVFFALKNLVLPRQGGIFDGQTVPRFGGQSFSALPEESRQELEVN